MKVYFSHGKESGPWGSKIQRLASIASEHGCEVDSVDYTDLKDPDLRVERLLSILKKNMVMILNILIVIEENGKSFL